MANTNFRTVDEYIASRPPDVQKVLHRLRTIICEALPGAEEVISYQIAAYKLGGARVIYFAGWKEHYSLYPVTAALVAAFGDEISGYKVSKGTLRFPLSEPIPARLIERIVKFRAQEALEKEVPKSAKARKKQ